MRNSENQDIDELSIDRRAISRAVRIAMRRVADGSDVIDHSRGASELFSRLVDGVAKDPEDLAKKTGPLTIDSRSFRARMEADPGFRAEVEACTSLSAMDAMNAAVTGITPRRPAETDLVAPETSEPIRQSEFASKWVN